MAKSIAYIESFIDPGRTDLKMSALGVIDDGNNKPSFINFNVVKTNNVIVIFKSYLVEKLIQDKEPIPNGMVVMNCIDDDRNSVKKEYFVIGKDALKFDQNHPLVESVYHGSSTSILLEKVPLFLSYCLVKNNKTLEISAKDVITDKTLFYGFNISLTKEMQSNKTFIESKEFIAKHKLLITLYEDGAVNTFSIHGSKVNIVTSLQGEGILNNIILNNNGEINKEYVAIGTTTEENHSAMSSIKTFVESGMTKNGIIIDIGSEEGNILFTKGLTVDPNNTYIIKTNPNKLMEELSAEISRRTGDTFSIHKIQQEFFIPNVKFKGIDTRKLYLEIFNKMKYGESLLSELRSHIHKKKTRDSDFNPIFIVFGGGITQSINEAQSPFVDSVAYPLIKEFIDPTISEQEISTYMKYILPHGIFYSNDYLVKQKEYDTSLSHIIGLIKNRKYNILLKSKQAKK